MLKDRNTVKTCKVYDQTTDRSGAVLVKIASRMANPKLAEMALNALFRMDRELSKTASSDSKATFPVDNTRNVFLSRIYFEGQREKLAADKAAEIDAKLATYEALYGIHNKVAFKEPGVEKTASKEIELLPLCKIASSEELIQSGNDFSSQFDRLAQEDRRVFARNFVKAASELGVSDIPDEVRIYAGEGVEGRPDLMENILFRKIAMERQGKSAGGYDVLYFNLLKLDTGKMPNEDLRKIAEALETADDMYGMSEGRHGKSIPDAWHSVFQVKKAEEDDSVAKPDLTSMSKAEIIGKYGEGILEEVEKDNGDIDYEKLKQVLSIVDNPVEKANVGGSEA